MVLNRGNSVLEHPGLDVVHAGHAVGGGRALVEGPQRAARRSARASARRRSRPPAAPASRARSRAGRSDRQPGESGASGDRSDACDMVRCLQQFRADARSGVTLLEGRTSARCGGPAVPPSLAAANAPDGPGGATARSRILRPGLLGPCGSRDGSSGGSGVIWSAGPGPGLTLSPVRSWQAVSGSCPIDAVQAPRISDGRRIPDRITGRSPGAPLATRRASATAGHSSGGGQGVRPAGNTGPAECVHAGCIQFCLSAEFICGGSRYRLILR